MLPVTPAPLLFVADVHLVAQPDTRLEQWLAFLEGPVQQAQALYILGDLFEYWVGDDADTPASQRVASALASLPCPVFFQHGNRDFLLGADYAARAGMTLLPEVMRLTAAGHPLLLTHGDQLCTADHAHLAFRTQVRSPAWQNAFLALPLTERIAEAERLRALSQAAGQQKSMEIMDVQPEAVTELLLSQGSERLIHGHTHRPALHSLPLPHGASGSRWVLPAWDFLPGYLALTGNEPRMLTLDATPYPLTVA
jgi:UDP-2,3-diacylglucosamine hydrolase